MSLTTIVHKQLINMPQKKLDTFIRKTSFRSPEQQANNKNYIIMFIK